MSCLTIEKETFRSYSMSHFNVLMNLATRGKIPVLLIGEYGSGRSHTAAVIHQLSDHPKHNYKHFRCLPLQQEFRSAAEFEKLLSKTLSQVKGGTLFLDKLDQLPMDLLARLLEFFKKKLKTDSKTPDFEALDIKIIGSIDVRTFDRLPVDPIWSAFVDFFKPFLLHQPPLRDRLEDIPSLMESFMMEFKGRNPKFKVNEFSPSTIYRCLFYDWPGNIRQLKNVVIYSGLIAPGTTIYPDSLPPYLQRSTYYFWQNGTYPIQNSSFMTAEKNFLNQLLGQTDSVDEVSSLLGISFPKLQSKLETYNLNLKSDNYIN